jgi:hypothetical protein
MIALSTDGGLPSSFVLFNAGVNRTTKGDFLFDQAAAERVMASFQSDGVDLLLDLEHRSLDPNAPNFSTDAMAWFQLAVQDGALWAVNVRWTPAGQTRLLDKSQRYISPAFRVDKEGRILSVTNAGLVSMPATKHAASLIAASKGTMNAESFKAAIEALKSGDAEAALSILEQLLVEAATGDAGSKPDAKSGSGSGDPAASPPGDPNAPAAASKDVKPEETKTEEKAASKDPVADLFAALGVSSVEEIQAWKSAADASAEAKRGIELSSRRVLVGDLVKLGVETPATAWADADKLIPAQRLTDEPLDDLRKRVGLLKLSKKPNEKPPVSASKEVSLSADELAECKKRNIDPTTYAARKAAAIRRS